MDPIFRRRSGSLVLASLLCACAQPEAPPPAVAAAPVPVVASPTADAVATDKAAEAAADRLRDLVEGFDPEACVGASEALRLKYPASSRLRAWSIVCIADAGRRIEAAALAEAMRAERPGDPWAEFATAGVATVGASPQLEALGATEALVRTLADHPDALRLRARALLGLGEFDPALALADKFGEVLQSARVRAKVQASADAPDKLAEALTEAERVTGVAAIDAAEAAAQGLVKAERFADAKPWSDKAIAASSGSVKLRVQRWQILQKLADGSDDDRKAAVIADVEALLALRGDQPSALLAAADALRQQKMVERADALEGRLAAEFADSPAHEALLYRRIGAELGPDGEPRPERRAELRAQVDAFLARPRPHDPDAREHVGRLRFDALRGDPSTTPDDLLAAIEFMRVAGRTDIEAAHILGPLALAERAVHLARAEALAREGVAAVARFEASMRAGGLPDELREMLRRDRLGSVHDALGMVLLAAGRIDEAEAAFKESLAVSPGYAVTLAHIAEAARRRGDLDAAEAHLVAGYGQDLGPRENPCRTMLTALYQERHGSMKGFDKYVDGVKTRVREARKAAVLARKAADPQPVPAFALKRLDGTEVTSDSLRGKVVMIKFWFTTCPPCIIELPEFAALIKDYARQRDVEILSIHSGGETDEVAAWMREHKHEFPVLLDGGYCKQAGVTGFPTFWVLDRDGRIAYTEHGGATGRLREEFAWRIESLRARG